MSVVIGIRIPKKLKEEIDRLGINYAKEVRQFLEELVRREKLKRLLKDIEQLRKESPCLEGNLAAKFIREDRDAR